MVAIMDDGRDVHNLEDLITPELDQHLFHVGDGIQPPSKKGDVGYDLVVSETVLVGRGKFANIPHDAAVQLPEGVWAMIFARSGTNIAGKLVVLPGVIDNGYRGRLFAMVHNVSNDLIRVREGTRICQLVLFPMLTYPLVQRPFLQSSARGTSGFGSTGGTHDKVENPNHTGG